MTHTFVKTESGATYEFADNFAAFRRTSPNAPLRKDGEWLACNDPKPQKGLGMAIIIHGIVGAPGVTIRRTTPVVAIWEG